MTAPRTSAETKNQWARDDPAFVVITSLLVAVAAAAYCVACVAFELARPRCGVLSPGGVAGLVPSEAAFLVPLGPHLVKPVFCRPLGLAGLATPFFGVRSP